MKKLILFSILFAIAFISTAQTKAPRVATDGSLEGSAYVYIGGTSADTLTNADTLVYTMRVTSDATQDYLFRLYNDFVSGTAGGKLKTYKSINGTTWEVTAAADSITVSGLTADALDSEAITVSDFLYPYLKVVYTQSGTAKTVPKVYIYTKKN